MSLYRIYIDETGNHDLTHADDPNQRFLALTGIILESEYNTSIFQPELESIKRQFFKHDPDAPVILHRKEIINRRPPFESLRNPEVEARFNQVVLDGLARWQYRVITVVIDKKAHRDQYTVWRYHPYHYCLAVILERFVLFLHYGGHRGDVMVESRGRVEDEKLKDSFQRLYKHGTEHIPAERWQQYITSGELKVKPKTANIAGLQLADLIAHPSRREILLDYRLINDERNTFGDKISAILQKDKYLRSRDGKIYGYGKKCCHKERNALSGVPDSHRLSTSAKRINSIIHTFFQVSSTSAAATRSMLLGAARRTGFHPVHRRPQRAHRPRAGGDR